MAFDEKLAAGIRAHLGKRIGVSERKMFGGITFLLQGNMCCGVHRNALIVRLGPEEAGRALGGASHTSLRSDWASDEGLGLGGTGGTRHRCGTREVGRPCREMGELPSSEVAAG